MDELSRWPALNAENLHPFRIKIKELRYILQLVQDADLKFVDALEKVKQKIGDWHDWQELYRIAAQLLDPAKDRIALIEIEEKRSIKYQQALKAARTLRTRYLGAYRGLTIAEP
jgi:CHAD domain-containing protein